MLGMLRMVEWLQEGFGVANFSVQDCPRGAARTQMEQSLYNWAPLHSGNSGFPLRLSRSPRGHTASLCGVGKRRVFLQGGATGQHIPELH